MEYHIKAFISVTIFALVHLFAAQALKLNRDWYSRFLSTGGGVAIAYVFIDLLPKLSKFDVDFRQLFGELFPYIEHHVFVMALLGFILFFAVDRSQFLF